jgi:hypothetical protein
VFSQVIALHILSPLFLVLSHLLDLLLQQLVGVVDLCHELLLILRWLFWRVLWLRSLKLQQHLHYFLSKLGIELTDSLHNQIDVSPREVNLVVLLLLDYLSHVFVLLLRLQILNCVQNRLHQLLLSFLLS